MLGGIAVRHRLRMTDERATTVRMFDPRPFVFHLWRTAMTSTPHAVDAQRVDVNGAHIHYVETGAGRPVVLVNNGMVSGSDVWADTEMSFAATVPVFADGFRVFVPDIRGSGRSVAPDGPISHAVIADDLAAFISALGLVAPGVVGFSDGGTIATVLGIRHPDVVGAVVNLGGHDALDPNPAAASYVMTRQMLGGSSDATDADPDVAARQIPMLADMIARMRSDHDAAQGPDHWRVVYRRTFERVSRPSGYTIADLSSATAPMMIAVGDRDPFCPVEDGAAAQRALPDGELAVLPGTGHAITTDAAAACVEFLCRRLGEI
jgi:pimeloyl-ACP methyl ester carboxylesterase